MITKTLTNKRLMVVILFAALVLATLGVTSLSTYGTSVTSQLSPIIFTPAPLSTSLQTSGGVWATVPMGRLSSPLTTFWQLLFRPVGTSKWEDLAGETETGTNGGLILASPNGRSVDVAIRPTNHRTFSPILTTMDNGQSWLNGLVEPGVVDHPNALAASGHDAFALVANGQGTQLEASSSSLSRWQVVGTQSGVAASAGGIACGLSALTAVAFLSSHDLVGGVCTRAGVVPLFQRQGTTWRLVHLTLPDATIRDTAEVLGLRNTRTGVSALIETSSHTNSRLVVASWSYGHWKVSRPLVVPRSVSVRSYGPSSENGLFVLLASRSQVNRLEVLNNEQSGWRQIVSPPAKTATVAFGSGTQVEAFTANHSTLTIWQLASDSHRWLRVQSLDILQGPTSSASGG